MRRTGAPGSQRDRPAHCTGWPAQRTLAERFPAAFIPSTVGTRFERGLVGDGRGVHVAAPADGAGERALVGQPAQALVLDGGSWRNVTSDTIHNFLSRDGVTPAELRASALEQLNRYPTVRVQAASAEAADGGSGNFRVTLSDGRTVGAHRLLLATGVEDGLPDIPGLQERWGQSVVHCPYCHGWERVGLALGVLATDEWAVHEAVHIRRFSDDVTLYTNGGSTMTADQRELLETRDVAVRDEQLARLDGAGTSLERLVFTGGTSAACRALFCRPRMRQRSDLAARLGCRLLDDGAVEVNEYAQTTVPGVYAVGDMARRADFPFPAAQLVIAAAEGTLAAVVFDQELLYND